MNGYSILTALCSSCPVCTWMLHIIIRT